MINPLISVVMPCLNEELSVGICIDKINKVFCADAVSPEIIVVDNGSHDDSYQLAQAKGATAFFETRKGYGAACLRGLKEAKGEYLVFADADDTYDFLDLRKFIDPLVSGECDLVNGTRLKGKIGAGAMPLLHLYIGNPFLTWFYNRLFRRDLTDVLSGYKSISKKACEMLDCSSSDMRFTAEIMVKAACLGLRIKEIPITYSMRKTGSKTKLSSFRDGWRYFIFFIVSYFSFKDVRTKGK